GDHVRIDRYGIRLVEQQVAGENQVALRNADDEIGPAMAGMEFKDRSETAEVNALGKVRGPQRLCGKDYLSAVDLVVHPFPALQVGLEALLHSRLRRASESSLERRQQRGFVSALQSRIPLLHEYGCLFMSHDWDALVCIGGISETVVQVIVRIDRRSDRGL